MRKAILVLPVLLLVLAVPSVYAVSYSGSAGTSCGSSDGSCVLVESYVYDGDYTVSPIITEKIGVTKNGSTYSLSAESVLLTPSDLYLRIYGVGYDGDIEVSCDITVTGVGSCTAYLDGSILTDTVVSQGYHSFSLRYSGTYSGSSFPDTGIALDLTVSAVSTGSKISSAEPLRLKATSSASVLEILEMSNPDIVTSEDYGFSTDTSVNHGNNYPAASISNGSNAQGGIADRSGNIDLDIMIPSGPSFVLYLRTSGSNTFSLTMTKGDQTLVSGTVTFNAGWGTSGYYLSSKSYDGSSSGYFYSSLNNVNTYDAWMIGDSDDIHIRILTDDGQDASQSLKMDIVFKKE